MEDEVNEIILTSKLGRFIFDRSVKLSHAKIVRDTITAQFFDPDPKRIMIDTEEDAYKYMRHHPTAEFASVPFAVSFDPAVAPWLKKAG